MTKTRRSGRPIHLTLEILGYRWSRIVIRDVMSGNRRHFGGSSEAFQALPRREGPCWANCKPLSRQPLNAN